jgi:hypothetical protein
MDKKSAELIQNIVIEDGNKIGSYDSNNNNKLLKTGQNIVNDKLNN